MGKLIYSMLMSLDGYTEDEHRRFGWGAPEDGGGAFVHQRTRVVGWHLPVWAEDVRDDGLLGDRAHDPRSTAVRARVGAAVAGDREGGLLEDRGRAA